jgi:hypothetical protein
VFFAPVARSAKRSEILKGVGFSVIGEVHKRLDMMHGQRFGSAAFEATEAVTLHGQLSLPLPIAAVVLRPRILPALPAWVIWAGSLPGFVVPFLPASDAAESLPAVVAWCEKRTVAPSARLRLSLGLLSVPYVAAFTRTETRLPPRAHGGRFAAPVARVRRSDGLGLLERPAALPRAKAGRSFIATIYRLAAHFACFWVHTSHYRAPW